MTAIALCYSGVVHGYLKQPNATSHINMFIAKYAKELHENGGDWRSRHIPAEAPTGIEADWLSRLQFCEPST